MAEFGGKGDEYQLTSSQQGGGGQIVPPHTHTWLLIEMSFNHEKLLVLMSQSKFNVPVVRLGNVPIMATPMSWPYPNKTHVLKILKSS